MASWAEGRLQDPGYKHYILAGLAWDWLCKQLEPYLLHVINDLHSDLLQNGHTTPVCHHTNASTYKEVTKCLQMSCGSSVRLLENCHVSGSVRQCWRNSQIERWEAHPWSLALLFMDPGKDPNTNLAPGDTDISGVMNLMLHCTRFTMNKNLVNKIQAQRNKSVHHSSAFEMEAAEFNDLIDDINNLLSDPCVAPHVTGNVATYLDNVKQLKMDITFHDEITGIRQMMVNMEQRQAQLMSRMEQSQAEKFVELVEKHDDLKKAFSKDLTDIKHSLEQMTAACNIQTTDQQDESNINIREISDENKHSVVPPPGFAESVPAVEQNQAWKKKIIADLKQALNDCYSHPEYRYLNPLLDGDDALGYFIESVFVEVSLAQRQVKPIQGKRGLEESLRQVGKPVQNINDMIPPPGGHRVLLTGFVGSGKTSLCLHWLHEWANKPEDESKAIYKNIHLYDLVIFLRARALENSIQHSLANVMEHKIHHLRQKKEHDIEAVLMFELPTLIIIDGYDEASRKQKYIVDDLVAYKTLTHASVIITSRPNFFHGKIEYWYDNLGFKREQQLAFIRKFKVSIEEECKEHFEAFEKRFDHSENATVMFTSPMIAMTTCIMVAEGEEVEFESRVKNYMQLTEFFAKRACFKYKIEKNHLTEAMPAFAKAAYTNLVKNASFQFSRTDLRLYMDEDTLDNIIVKLGYLSVTKYTLRFEKEFAYTFIHKSWAEFTAARYVMSLPFEDRCTAVCELFKSGAANLEVLRFALGLCSQDEPEHIASLFKAAGEVIQDLDIDAETVRDEMETIRAAWDDEADSVDIRLGSQYLLQLLTDVDPGALAAQPLCELSRVCAAIRRAGIEEDKVSERVEGKIDLSNADSAVDALYAGLLLTAHSTQNTLHTVREVRVGCEPSSPHNTITRLPATLATCARSMIALTEMDVKGLASATELSEICGGLTTSGVPCLTSLILRGETNGELTRVAGIELGPVLQVVKAASQLTELQLQHIHCGEEHQLHTLCAAIGEASPQLTFLSLGNCCVSSRQYGAVLVPALQQRLTATGARMQWVNLTYEADREGEDWDSLEAALEEVADSVDVR